MLDPLISNDGGTFTKRVRLRLNRALQEDQWRGGVIYTDIPAELPNKTSIYADERRVD